MSSSRVRRALAVTVLASSPVLVMAPAAMAAGAPHKPGHALVGARRGAEAVLKQDVRRLAAVSSHEQASKVINATDKAALLAAVGTSTTSGQAYAIAQDQAAVAAATSLAQIRGAVVSGRTTLSAAYLDWHIVVAADRIEARAAVLDAKGAALLTKAQAAGNTTAEATLADLTTRTTAADTAAQAAVTEVLGLSSTAKPSDVRAARATAGKDLVTARKALAAALHDTAKATGELAG